MAMTHGNRSKTGTKKPVPVSGASDMQFGTEFFWNRTRYFHADLWYRLSGTGFRRRFLVRVSWALIIIAQTLSIEWERYNRKDGT